ncbi:MAG: HD domain-containing protein [Candidatus Thorarchaeota archaeon]
MNPKDIVNLLKSAEKLKHLQRTGWATEGVETVTKESIAAHSWGTSFISLVISKFLIDKGNEIDLGRVLTMSAIHDLVESATSDIPQGAIALGTPIMKEAKSNAERSAMRSLASALGTVGEELIREWTVFAESDEIEARIVRDADIIDMLVHAVALEDSGVSPRRVHAFFVSALRRLENSKIEISKEIWKVLLDEHERNAARQQVRLE